MDVPNVVDGPADGVPDGIEGGDGGAELSVHPEEPPLQLRQEVPGKEAAGGGPPPGGHQDSVGLQPARLSPVGEGDGRAGGDAGDAGSGEHLHPVLPELRGQTLAQLPLQGGQEAGGRLQDGDAGACGGPDTRQLHPDHSAADDG